MAHNINGFLTQNEKETGTFIDEVREVKPSKMEYVFWQIAKFKENLIKHQNSSFSAVKHRVFSSTAEFMFVLI